MLVPWVVTPFPGYHCVQTFKNEVLKLGGCVFHRSCLKVSLVGLCFGGYYFYFYFTCYVFVKGC